MAGESHEAGKTEAQSASVGGGDGGASKLPILLSLVNTLITVGVLIVLVISFLKQKEKASVDDISTQTAPKEGAAEGHGEGKEAKSGEGGKETEHPKGDLDKRVEDARGRIITLDQFTVNLSTPGSVSPRFARVNIAIEVPNEETEGELNAKIPQVRNAVIDLFNSKKPTDLATVEGREFLKEEIKNALDSFLLNGKVRGVFFTSFALSP